MRVDIPMEIPDEAIEEIIKDAQKKMAQEVIEYLDDQKKDLIKADTTESRFVLYGMRIAEKKLERYI